MSDLFAALRAMAVSTRQLEPGQLLFHAGDPVAVLHLVDQGCVQLVRSETDGTIAVMQRATNGAILAESSIFSDRYHCSAESITLATVTIIPIHRVRDRLAGDPEFATFLAHHLAREVQGLRGRAELLSRRTVAGRLDGWLAMNGGSLPQKGGWNRLAADLGVTPEALYRELQQRRKRAR